MILGIDASNVKIFGGGCYTYLFEILNNIDPTIYGITKCIVWSNTKTLMHLPDKFWIEKKSELFLNKSIVFRTFWQHFLLNRRLSHNNCTILFSPGGSLPLLSLSIPSITMFRNILPFDKNEVNKYKSIVNRIRLLLLQNIQTLSFKKAHGLIFLTEYARVLIKNKIKNVTKYNTIIAHGLNNNFYQKPSEQFPIGTYSYTKPFKLLYVSTVYLYKNQWHVAKAIKILRDQGYCIEIDFVGHSEKEALVKFQNAIKEIDPSGNFIHYHKFIPYNQLYTFYHNSNAFVFASGCENLPNILIEAMASGLPIASSNRGPMPEILKKAGIYFDPEKPIQIAEAIKKLLDDHTLRKTYAEAAYTQTLDYSWKTCAQKTFQFIKTISELHNFNK